MNSSTWHFAKVSVFCVLGEPVIFPAPESNGFIKKRSYIPPGPGTPGSVSGVCCVHSAAVFWLLFPSGQSSAEFLLSCSGQCLDLG